MTDVMNFFQTMFMFRNFAPTIANKQEVRLAVWLKCEAETLAEKGDEEMRNGRMTQDLSFEAKDVEKTRVFAEIAVWHNGRAAEKYRKSAERYEEAGKIQTGKRREFNLKAKEMKCRAAQAEAAVNSLNDFLTQN